MELQTRENIISYGKDLFSYFINSKSNPPEQALDTIMNVEKLTDIEYVSGYLDDSTQRSQYLRQNSKELDEWLLKASTKDIRFLEKYFLDNGDLLTKLCGKINKQKIRFSKLAISSSYEKLFMDSVLTHPCLNDMVEIEYDIENITDLAKIKYKALILFLLKLSKHPEKLALLQNIQKKEKIIVTLIVQHNVDIITNLEQLTILFKNAGFDITTLSCLKLSDLPQIQSNFFSFDTRKEVLESLWKISRENQIIFEDTELQDLLYFNAGLLKTKADRLRRRDKLRFSCQSIVTKIKNLWQSSSKSIGINIGVVNASATNN